MNELEAVSAMGFSLPSPAYLFGMIFFGVVGFAAYRYGRKTSRSSATWIGVALMLYPYVVSGTWQLYAVGVGLCAGLYYYRR